MKTVAAKQRNKLVTEYANILQNPWQALDHYQVLETKYPEDAVNLKKFIEKDRVYVFLVGLNVEFDQVRIQILGKEDVLLLNEVIALIRAEESQKGIMLVPVTNIGYAMVAQENTNQNKINETSMVNPLLPAENGASEVIKKSSSKFIKSPPKNPFHNTRSHSLLKKILLATLIRPRLRSFEVFLSLAPIL